jgi:hypothetical protein
MGFPIYKIVDFHIHVCQRVANNRKLKSFITEISSAITWPTWYRHKLIPNARWWGYSIIWHMTQRRTCENQPNSQPKQMTTFQVLPFILGKSLVWVSAIHGIQRIQLGPTSAEPGDCQLEAIFWFVNLTVAARDSRPKITQSASFNQWLATVSVPTSPWYIYIIL